MAHPSEELAMAWSSITSAASDAVGWRSIAISRPGALTLHAGRRYPGGEEALLACFAAAALPPSAKLPDGYGFAVERADLLADGVAWLALTRRSSASIELFAAMARDVAEVLDRCPASDEPRALMTLLGRVRAWQEFMRKGASVLSPEVEVGLFGELSVLVAIIECGVDPATACGAWHGPLDGLRDFEIGTGGLEVKSTLSSTGFPARVGSLEQLDDSACQPLFVAGVRLWQTAGGRSLPDAVGWLRDVVRGDHEAERLLEERLLASGYFDAHADKYPRRFEVESLRVLPVVEGFPRLTPGRVPYGVSRATYDIDLDKAPGLDVGIESALKNLGALRP